MAIDYGEKEQQFLASLKADTGRDLDEWMAAIRTEKLTHRNDVIDWLRRQGFMFSKASWLERIHNNAGRPVYSGKSATRPARRAPAERRTSPITEPTLAPIPAPVPTQAPAPAPTLVAGPAPAGPRPDTTAAAVAAPPSTTDLSDLLAKAKAFRPLAQFVLAEVAKAAPGATTTTYQSHVSIALGGTEFAVLAISSRELRLGLALSGRAFEAGFGPARFHSGTTGIPAHITHMIVLTDARQLNADLIARVKDAARMP